LLSLARGVQVLAKVPRPLSSCGELGIERVVQLSGEHLQSFSGHVFLSRQRARANRPTPLTLCGMSINMLKALAGLLFVVVGILGITCQSARAQSGEPRREIGGFVGAISFHEALAEKPFAAGLRFGYRLTRLLAVEAELNSCPQNPSGN